MSALRLVIADGRDEALHPDGRAYPNQSRSDDTARAGQLKPSARDPWSEGLPNDFIALAQAYEMAPSQTSDVDPARLVIRLLVGLVAVAAAHAQTAVLGRVSRPIERQRTAFTNLVRDVSRMLRDNTILRHGREASLRVTVENERILRRLGADLHDGPIQLIATSLLRLDTLGSILNEVDSADADEARQDVLIIREVLTDALGELRGIAAGLTLPELEKLTLPDLFSSVVRRHERRTGTSVACHIIESPCKAPVPLKVCLYRFVQEGLNNAFRHADGNGQAIHGTTANGQFMVEITDEGPLFGSNGMRTDHVGQGLIGLRDRVQSLGGAFSFTKGPHGARLSAAFDLALLTATQEDVHD